MSVAFGVLCVGLHSHLHYVKDLERLERVQHRFNKDGAGVEGLGV